MPGGKLRKPTQNWSWAPNEIVNNPNLSLKAKGLWLYINGKPNGWNFSTKRIAEEQKDGRDAVAAAIRELEEAGLLSRAHKSNGYATFETIYELRATPQFNAGKFNAGKYGTEKYGTEKPVTLIKQNKVKQTKEKKNKENMSTAPKAQPTRELPKEALQLAERLHKWILKNKPDRRIEEGWKELWSAEIDRMHRLDGRSWRAITAAIDWSQRDEFWRQNILSGKKLRQHYDRIEDRARSESGAQIAATAAFQMTDQEAIKYLESQKKS